ncbi:hypothetical protein PTKIN_Ptkin16aG0077900 [Pterospermum kingtungense]
MKLPTLIKRRELVSSPADTNELPRMELPWAWEPMNSSSFEKLVKQQDSHAIFLSKTKMHVSKLERIRLLCGMSGCMSISSEGKNEGLAMLWKEEVDLNLRSLSKHHIDMEVHKAMGHGYISVTSKRSYGAMKSREITSDQSGRWKTSGQLSKTAGFMTWDMSGVGTRGRGEQKFTTTLERDWIEAWPMKGGASFLTTTKCNIYWLQCQTIAPSWFVMARAKQEQNTGVRGGVTLKQWHYEKFGKDKKKIKELEKELESLQKNRVDNVVLHRSTEVKKKLNALMEKEELFWFQRSREKRNTIKELEDDEGVYQWEPDKIEAIIVKYFKVLFATENVNPEGDVLNSVQQKITNEMNYALIKKFSADEVYDALKQMHLLKAPSLTSKPAIFFQQY